MPAARPRPSFHGRAAGRSARTRTPGRPSRPPRFPSSPAGPAPDALDEAGIDRTIGHFVAAAKRAERTGFDFVELHCAHGYLIQTFLSPLSNHRTDQWGGSLENRMRLARAVARAVRAALPASMPVGARLSCTDWIDGGFTPDEAVAVATALKADGVAFICASAGGLHPDAKPPEAPSYMVPFAERIRREAGIITRAVGLIDEPMIAEAIVADGRADLVALARAILADPRWPWRAASLLGEAVHPVDQYARCARVIAKWAPPVTTDKAAA